MTQIVKIEVKPLPETTDAVRLGSGASALHSAIQRKVAGETSGHHEDVERSSDSGTTLANSMRLPKLADRKPVPVISTHAMLCRDHQTVPPHIVIQQIHAHQPSNSELRSPSSSSSPG